MIPPFVPLSLQFCAEIDPAVARVKFSYPENTPGGTPITVTSSTSSSSASGPEIRIWTKDGNVSRNPADLASGGDFAGSGISYSLADLPLDSGSPDNSTRRLLFVEGVTPSTAGGDARIEVRVDPDGAATTFTFDLKDAVQSTIHKVDLDIDSDNDNRHDPPDRSQAEEDAEETAPGKIIILNADDDDSDGTRDSQNETINGNDDRDNDMADMVVEVRPAAWDTAATDVVLDASNYNRVRVFKQDGTLLLGPSAASEHELAPGDLTGGTLNLVVEGVELGEATVSLIWRTASGTEVCREDVVVTIRNDLQIAPQWQRKDSSLLCVDGCSQAGVHRWDTDHGTRGCAHETFYCVPASTSVLASYYGGTLTQDRLAFQINGGGGPENDLGHNSPYSTAQVEAMLSWALNGTGVTWDNTPTWNEILNSLICYRPLFCGHPPAPGAMHAVVIDGFHVDATGKRYIHVLDPWTGNEAQHEWGTYALWGTFTPPHNQPATGARSDEATVSSDADGDGIADFDELQRFAAAPWNLDWQDDDSDADGVLDKQEVIDGVFAP